MRFASLNLLAVTVVAALTLPMVSYAGGGGMHHDASSGHESFPFGHPGDAKRVDRVIKITANEFSFMPSSLTVKAGETIKFVVTNAGKIKHEFVLGTKSEQREHDKEMQAMPHMKMDDPNGISIPKGETASLIWTFTKPMVIQYACHEPGHYAAGMYGELSVK